MGTADELRLQLVAEGLKCKVIDLAPPIDEILAGLSEADREHAEFISYVKANHSHVEAAIIPAPDEV